MAAGLHSLIPCMRKQSTGLPIILVSVMCVARDLGGPNIVNNIRHGEKCKSTVHLFFLLPRYAISYDVYCLSLSSENDDTIPQAVDVPLISSVTNLWWNMSTCAPSGLVIFCCAERAARSDQSIAALGARLALLALTKASLLGSSPVWMFIKSSNIVF